MLQQRISIKAVQTNGIEISGDDPSIATVEILLNDAPPDEWAHLLKQEISVCREGRMGGIQDIKLNGDRLYVTFLGEQTEDALKCLKTCVNQSNRAYKEKYEEHVKTLVEVMNQLGDVSAENDWSLLGL